MIVQSLALSDFRNYGFEELSFHHGINIFYGDNAQGKTNILEGIYLCMTNKSYRGSRDRDMIRFGKEEAHLRLEAEKKDIPYRVDMHLKKAKTKGIAINGAPIRRSSELIGLLNVVFFSPEDLQVIKNGPGERRRFLDMELCQLDKVYLHLLTHYSKCLAQRNALLKEIDQSKDARTMLDVWDAQLVQYGVKIILLREEFVSEIAPVIAQIYHSLTGGREELFVSYEPNVTADRFEQALFMGRDREIRQKTTLTGPHRDDIRFRVRNKASGDETDIRTFGSQGQQRSAALALKLAEIEVVKQKTKDTPVLLLDDVLSELDSSRQNYLLESIHDIQTFITCTGLEEFVNNRFEINRVFKVSAGTVTCVNENMGLKSDIEESPSDEYNFGSL